MPKLWLQKIVLDLVAQVAADPEACSLFARAVEDDDRDAFMAYIEPDITYNDPRDEEDLRNTDFFSLFVSACNTPGNPIPHILIEANTARLALWNAKKAGRNEFIQTIGFNAQGRAEKKRKFADIPQVEVKALDESYPPMNTWVYENPEIGERWREHLESGPQPDGRKKRHPMMELDPKLIIHDIEPEKEAVFYDDNGEFIGMVCRNFCPHEGVLPAIGETIADAVDHRKDARLEDPGSLIQMGFSAGSRSSPAFDWVKNLKQKTLPEQVVSDMDYRGSSAFALFWNLCRDLLPYDSEVMEDFDRFLDECNMVRMQSGKDAAKDFIAGDGLGTHGEYTVRIGEVDFDFKDAEMAPPAGVFGQNYSRSMHLEYQPHKYALAWTVRRDHPPEAGGHFFIGKYGIRIQAAANSLVIWRPTDPHGTSLQDLDPDDPNPRFLQRGLAIVTSNRLPGVWEKYWRKEYSHEQSLKMLAKDNH